MQKMNETVRIKITGIQEDEFGNQNQTESLASGSFFEKNGGYYLFYEEIPEGEKEVVKNRIKYRKDELEVVKTGLVTTTMRFRQGESTKMEYRTSLGTFYFETKTDSVSCLCTESKVVLRVGYDLLSEGALVGKNQIKIEIGN